MNCDKDEILKIVQFDDVQTSMRFEVALLDGELIKMSSYDIDSEFNEDKDGDSFSLHIDKSDARILMAALKDFLQ